MPERKTKRLRRSWYASKSSIGRSATPLAIAALATAGAIRRIRRWSNGFGIRYSAPKVVSPVEDTSSAGSCAS